MPTYNSALLPSTSGLTFGSSALRWSGYFTDIDVSGNVTLASGTTLSGLTWNPKVLGEVRYASQFPGADAGVKIAAAIVDLPITGGIVVADFEGAQTCSVNPLSGLAKPLQLLLGAATFTISAQWDSSSASNLIVRGCGRTATILKASGSFPTSTPLINVGDGSTLIFGVRYENLKVDCNGVSGSTCFNGRGLNEQSGGSYLFLNGYMTNGIKLSGVGVLNEHFIFENIEITPRSTATGTDGILVTSNGGGGEIHHATINASAAVQQTGAGIHITGAGGNGEIIARGIHVENYADGMFFDTGTRGSIYSLDAKTATNVLHLSTTGAVAAYDLRQVSAVTNTLKDDGQSITITDAQLPVYLSASSAKGQQSFAWSGNASTFGNVISGNFPRFHIQSTSTAGTSNDDSAIEFWDGNRNGWRIRNQVSSSNLPLTFYPISAGTVGSLSVNFNNAGRVQALGGFVPSSAGGADLGSTALPIGNVWIGNAATNNIKLTGTATSAKVATLPDVTGKVGVYLTASDAAVDLASVANGAASTERTVTVTGAASGDAVNVMAATALEAGVFLFGKVTSADTVKWQLGNISGGAVDRASDTYTIKVIK